MILRCPPAHMRWQMVKCFVLHLPFRPVQSFIQLRTMDILALAVMIQVARWFISSFVTMSNLYFMRPAMLFPTPFGIEQQAYRFFEIFAYGPYGLVIITAIAYYLWTRGRDLARDKHPMTFRKTWEIVGVAYFTPWTPTIILDNILVGMGWGGPALMIPWHTAVVFVEMWLTAIGLRVVFGLPKAKANFLGVAGGFIFLFLAALVIR